MYLHFNRIIVNNVDWLFEARKEPKLPGFGQGTKLPLGEWQLALCCVSVASEKESVAVAEGELPVNVDCLGQGRRLSYWVWGKERS